MAKYLYSSKIEGAKAVGRDLPISMKHGVEICGFLRGKNLQTAKKMLQRVMEKKLAVPYKRHIYDLGHKRGIAAGRYPIKAAEQILKVIENAEVNAQSKGMNTANLSLLHISAQNAAKPMHSGRHRGREIRRAHIEIIAGEVKKNA